jgi:hypothetical protein
LTESGCEGVTARAMDAMRENMIRTHFLMSALVCASLACGDNEGGGGAGNGGGGQAESGGGGGDSSQGTSGSGGSAGAANPNAGGSSGGASGATGPGGMSGGGTMVTGIPKPSGTIGVGDVACPGVPGTKCSGGTACCYSKLDRSCKSNFSDCACSVGGSCTAVGCDSPDDCPGARCCALVNSRILPQFVATSCKQSCDKQSEVEVCLVPADCSIAADCQPSDAGFSTCF